MKTEQEQIEQIEKVLKDSVADYKHLKKKGVCYCYAETLIDHGYGNISEYKAEIERLKEVVKNYKEVLCETTQRKDDATKLNDTLVEEYENKIKQAKIDALNTAKERCDLVAEELEDEIDHYGSSVAYSCAYEIDELIKEVEAK